MAMRSHSRLTLYWLLTLDVRLPKGCRGMVPMTRGSSRHILDVPGTSTQTWSEERKKRFSHFCVNRSSSKSELLNS